MTLLDEVSTPTSVHHIIHRDISRLSEEEKHVFYALAEGSAKEEIHPAILELQLSDSDSDSDSDDYDDQLTWVDQVIMVLL